MSTSIITEVDNNVGILTLNRADRHNALDRALVAEMTAGVMALDKAPGVRAIVLSSAGKSFCAGTDPAWVRETLHGSAGDVLKDNRNLARLLAAVAGANKPTIARVQGAASGIGVGLVAACDIAFATYDASFVLNEARYGLLPAVAIPYLSAAMGERYCRYYMLTTERFSGVDAYRIGLVHEMVPDEGQLDEAISETIGALLKNSANAMTACKTLLRSIGGRSIDEKTIEETVLSATTAQSSADGQQGMLALVEKRKPEWGGKNGSHK
ncbi:MAG: enoyl-CoA hydratase/isomerase family protein [Candidatus Accumulibacter sp.]|jgi:methylglutaconyl-CoA hydratase|nr:enoyl-CoA hydratase/isomerase family protein [Accumulibacter sp.]